MTKISVLLLYWLLAMFLDQLAHGEIVVGHFGLGRVIDHIRVVAVTARMIFRKPNNAQRGKASVQSRKHVVIPLFIAIGVVFHKIVGAEVRTVIENRVRRGWLSAGL